MTDSLPGYLGDFKAGSVIDFSFSTKDASKVPTALAGAPVVSVYKANSLTQSTAGVALAVSFDGVVGLNHIRISTGDAYYETAMDYQVVVTTGTVGGVSYVGTRVGSFSLENRTARPDLTYRIPEPGEATYEPDQLAVGLQNINYGLTHTPPGEASGLASALDVHDYAILGRVASVASAGDFVVALPGYGGSMATAGQITGMWAIFRDGLNAKLARVIGVSTPVAAGYRLQFDSEDPRGAAFPNVPAVNNTLRIGGHG
jgi:hypothetical protein